MELTAQQREEIYKEEKALREKGDGSNSIEIFLLLNVLAAVTLAGLVILGKQPRKNRISIKAIRNAYSGLSPDELQ